MADETFKYPNASAPTKTLTFDISGHLNDDTETFVFNQTQDVTISGIRMVSNLGTHFNRFQYTAIIYKSHGSSTDWQDVLDFFGTSYANGGVNTFQWTDYVPNTATTVKLVNGSITKKNLGANTCQVNFSLEKDNG